MAVPPTEVVGLVVAGYGPPWVMAGATATPVGQPPKMTRPAKRDSRASQAAASGLAGLGVQGRGEVAAQAGQHGFRVGRVAVADEHGDRAEALLEQVAAEVGGVDLEESGADGLRRVVGGRGGRRRQGADAGGGGAGGEAGRGSAPASARRAARRERPAAAVSVADRVSASPAGPAGTSTRPGLVQNWPWPRV